MTRNTVQSFFERDLGGHLGADSQTSSQLLEFTDHATAGQAPFLAHPLVVDVLLQNTAAGKVFQEATSLVPGKPSKGLELQHLLLGDRGLGGVQGINHTLVSMAVGIGMGELGRRRVHTGMTGLDLFQGNIEAVDVGDVGGRSGIQEQAAVGESRLFGTRLQEREEMAHEHEIVGMDGLELRGAVLSGFHPVTQAIQGHKHRRTGLEVLLQSGSRRSRGELGPQSLEDIPGIGEVLNTQAREFYERHARLHRLDTRVVLGHLEALEDLFVGGDRARQEGGSCCVLDIQVGRLIGEWRVASVRND